MTLNETLKQLKALGSAKVRAQNAKCGAGDNQFGVSLGDTRALAKKIRTDHPMALSLWETGIVDAQFLATLLIQPRKLSAKEMDRMVRSPSESTSPSTASGPSPLARSWGSIGTTLFRRAARPPSPRSGFKLW